MNTKKTKTKTNAKKKRKSSRESTLAVGTKFDEMNHELGRSQTTKGVWLAKAAKPAGCPTLVMDLEGTDGRGGSLPISAHSFCSTFYNR